MTIGGGGGGGGGTGGGCVTGGGGELGAPGGGTTGGSGMLVSGWMQAERSKKRNSSALAWPERLVALQPVGNGLVGSESSLLPPAGGGASLTWMSVSTTRPHWLSAVASTGVLIVRYWTER